MEQVLGYTQFRLSKRNAARKPAAKSAAKVKGKRNAA
jgi:hypothetical protein